MSDSVCINRIDADDPKLFCRTCMGVKNEMFHIFNDNEEEDHPTIFDMITTCTNLEISFNDCLPLQICSECIKNLNMFYEFRLKCEEIDWELRRLFNDDPNRSEVPSKEGSDNVKRENDIYAFKQEPEDVKVELDFLPDICVPYVNSYEDIECEVSDSDLKLIDLKKVVKTQSMKRKLKYKCSQCSLEFVKSGKLRYHMRVHASKQNKSVHECDECHRKFDKASKLRRHLLMHDPTLKPFQCSQCPQRFKSQGALLTHTVSHASKSRGNSEDKENPNKADDGSELEDEAKFACAHCPNRYESNHSLSAHMRTHRVKGRVIACSVCGKVFEKWSHVQRHEKSHPSLRPHACAHCSRTFTNAHQLKEHNNKHVGLKPHKCPICKKSFAEMTTLITHVRSHTREKSFLCPSCGKRFDSSTNLKQHIRRHTGEKTFVCHLCPGRYVSKGELQSHMSTHTGARPFVCDTCGSSFTKPNSLAKHKLIHLGIRPYPCDVCPMKFSSRDHLKRHQRIHTGEKPYRCVLCERAFAQSNDLVKHTRSHLGDNMYKCSECSESFRLKTELRRHISTHFVEAAAKGNPPPDKLSLAALDPAPPIMVTSAPPSFIEREPLITTVPPVSLVVTFTTDSL